LFATVAAIALVSGSDDAPRVASAGAAGATQAPAVRAGVRGVRAQRADRATASNRSAAPRRAAPSRRERSAASPPRAKPRQPQSAKPPARAKRRTRPARVATAAPSLVAHPRTARVAIYASPQSPEPERTLARRTELGTRQAFLVDDARRDWVRVHLPTRPNGSTAWVKRESVALLDNHYRVEIDLSARRLTVFVRGRVLTSQTVAVGTSATPTPTGLYYIVELIRTTDPGGPYGPYAYALSAHSDVLQEFDGSDGRVGIHGTDAPGLLGQAVSHGCIRLRNSAITMLAKRLPLATPVRIKA
jgi:lipoprotein-anchoring transpeptidase ErfK/SrfK